YATAGAPRTNDLAGASNRRPEQRIERIARRVALGDPPRLEDRFSLVAASGEPYVPHADQAGAVWTVEHQHIRGEVRHRGVEAFQEAGPRHTSPGGADEREQRVEVRGTVLTHSQSGVHDRT